MTVYNDTAMKDVYHGTSSLQDSLLRIFSRSDCSSFFPSFSSFRSGEVTPATILVKKLVAVLESTEKLHLLTYECPGSGLQVCLHLHVFRGPQMILKYYDSAYIVFRYCFSLLWPQM